MSPPATSTPCQNPAFDAVHSALVPSRGLSRRINRSDRNDAFGIARIMQAGC